MTLPRVITRHKPKHAAPETYINISYFDWLHDGEIDAQLERRPEYTGKHRSK